MVIMTKDGATLFETIPRTVTFQPQRVYAAGTTGNSVYIDGVPLQGGTGGNTNASGKLAGLVQLRDSVAGTMQSQLDEIARGLDHRVRRDRRLRRSAADARRPLHLARRARPFPPPAPRRRPGRHDLAQRRLRFLGRRQSRICCATAAPTAPAMSHNTGGGASYADLLISYSRTARPADRLRRGGGDRHHAERLVDFSTNAISWFEGVRKDASAAAETKEALATRTARGAVQRDRRQRRQEMSLLLDLEHTYEASARLIKAVDDMLASLLAAVR